MTMTLPVKNLFSTVSDIARRAVATGAALLPLSGNPVLAQSAEDNARVRTDAAVMTLPNLYGCFTDMRKIPDPQNIREEFQGEFNGTRCTQYDYPDETICHFQSKNPAKVPYIVVKSVSSLSPAGKDADGKPVVDFLLYDHITIPTSLTGIPDLTPVRQVFVNYGSANYGIAGVKETRPAGDGKSTPSYHMDEFVPSPEMRELIDLARKMRKVCFGPNV